MPGAPELPKALKELAYRNAVEVRSGQDFRDHVVRLIRGIKGVARRGRSWAGGKLIIAACVIAVLLALLGMWAVTASGLLLRHNPRSSDPNNSATVPSPVKVPIKVGILFPQQGPMMDGSNAVHDAAQLAIEELNEQGGLLGRPIERIEGDGKSDYREFAALAERFVTQEHVAALFGCRASTNRKAVKPIVEKYDSLLFYPMPFEGLEDSPNIVYLGAAPNQQMMPAIDFMVDKQGKRRLFLVGSDYVFPHAANAILRDYTEATPFFPVHST
jgi:ABC-type branched-subunit amino acid transport system substrate-binding protein